MKRNVKYSALLILLLPFLIAADLQLSWDANTESDLAGYNVSYDGPASDRWETPCGPYEYSSMGLPLEGLVHTTTITIEDAATGNYAFYVRAYDEAGNMSGYNAYAGTLSLDGEIYTWSTVGVDAPDGCLPVALFVCSTTYGLSVNSLEVTFTNQSTENNPDTWEWAIWYNDNDTTTPDYTYSTENLVHTFPQGTSAVRLRVWNDTWFDDEWAYIYVTRRSLKWNTITPAKWNGVDWSNLK